MVRKEDCWKGPPCSEENCNSKFFFEENGLTYCLKGGHQQEGLRTQQDEDVIGSLGRKTRRKRERQEQVSQIYRGHAARELYLQAYQLILWKQCYALVHTIGLPGELETVVKDLWALRLQLLQNKIDATSDEETVFSSQPQTETDTETESKHGGKDKMYEARGKAMPSLIETLGLCYLGTVLIRLPISMGDIHWWAVREDIPFIRAVRFVPAAIKRRMPPEHLQRLDTLSPLEPDRLRRVIQEISLFYTHYFKLIWPPINTSLLLYKHVRDLALPITLHSVTLHISAMLSAKFDFPMPGKRQTVSSLPEIQLISFLVIAVKLQYPFDNLPRHVRSLSDPAALALDWPTWISARKARDSFMTPPGSFSRGAEINVTEKDVMSMTDEQLDDYMDYYERTFIDHDRVKNKKGALPQDLLDMFPTSRPDGSEPRPYSYPEHLDKTHTATEQNLKTVMHSLTPRTTISEARTTANPSTGEAPIRPIGSFYKRYRKASELQGPAKASYEIVAESVGIKLETLVVAVCQVENRLVRWRERMVKEGLVGDEEEDDGGDRDNKSGRKGDEGKRKGKGKGKGKEKAQPLNRDSRRNKHKTTKTEKSDDSDGQGEGEGYSTSDVDMLGDSSVNTSDTDN